MMMVGPELAIYLGHSLGVKLVLVCHGPWFVRKDNRAECVDDLFLADKGVSRCVKLDLLKVSIGSYSVWWKWQQEEIKGCTVPAGHVPSVIEKQQVASVWWNRLHAHLGAEYNGGLKFTGINVNIKVMFFETASVLKSLSPPQMTLSS